MTPWSRFLVRSVTSLVLLTALGLPHAHAQLSPNPLPQPAPGPTTKPEGVAEEAKEAADKLPTTPAIPQVKTRRKRLTIFGLDGYFRFRTEWMRNLHLGFNDRAEGGGPFPRPLTCEPDGNGKCQNNTLKSANMRLRLEPSINVSETARVYAQIDILDNIVLGSTPESLVSLSGATQSTDGTTDTTNAGTGSGVPATEGVSDNQSVPEAGKNYFTDSIRVRRAWAEVDTSLGHISVGRQPWHWGMGIFANAGGNDPFSGGYDLDDDYGDTVDRVMFRTKIPGTNDEAPILAGIAMDWVSTYPAAYQDNLYLGDGEPGQLSDLDDKDDVNQWLFTITRFDKPELFAEKQARGEFVYNYGVFVLYRTQGLSTRPTTEVLDGGNDDPDTRCPGIAGYLCTNRDLTMYTPNVWLKLGYGRLTWEVEGVLTLGDIGNISDIADAYNESVGSDTSAEPLPDGDLTIRRFGGASRLRFSALEDKLVISGEVGFASGDRWDSEPGAGFTHVRYERPLPVGTGDSTLSDFHFDPAYNVDLILFRELIGTVKNAIYIKPSVKYDVSSEIFFRISGIISMAHKSVATPGNSTFYGLELDGDLGYHSGNFFAGLTAGVFAPLDAMNHPEDLVDEGGVSQDAEVAATIQSRLLLRF